MSELRRNDDPCWQDRRCWTCPHCYAIYFWTHELDQGRYIPPHSLLGEPGMCVLHPGRTIAVRDGFFPKGE